MNRIKTIVLGLCVGATALGAGVALRQVVEARDSAAMVGTALGEPFNLIDQNGDPITEAAFVGKPNLLFFGFTHCPDVCPTTIFEMESWFEDLSIPPEQMGAFFVTIDPERDTPEFLKGYLEPQSERIVGITGAPEDVREMARSWRVYFQKRPLGEGEYTMDHFASVFVLDAEGKVVDLISYGEDADSAKAKIARVTG